ncbi:prolipoprotein diacylglyceryl transferase [Miniimonas arenae]|uniref:Phosphatidylglycerol--prolipoprotein diacylglyceryl transferase n=1 Tax=Miniimonas arenae TaxID=676201 RepID=A0A5C5BEL1_9MICO|nr:MULTISPECIES: prolipoprotein diacylglyceryl transferase [Miniimonas]TNU77026.1 prolipoprotein diacylglyceryl transferase [Miniimonas arenae]
MILADGIPSPSQGVWYLGPFPLRAYAIAILIGGFLAYRILVRRYAARGGPAEEVPDVVVWAVVFGIIGARLYHVVTSPAAYFGPDGDLVRILYIWQGGLGIWGAISLGAVGAWIGLRRAGLRFAPFADALAPGLLVAQAVGRLGNWFNQELFGSPTTLPWGLRVDDAVARAAGFPAGTLFHPTFLYELLWNLAAAAFLVWLDRRFRLGHGRVFWLYVMLYTAGRGWIEMLRVDDAQHVLGLRLNVWTAIIVFTTALVAFLVTTRRHPGRDETVWLPGRQPDEPDSASDGEPDSASDGEPDSASDSEPDSASDGEPTDGSITTPHGVGVSDPAERQGSVDVAAPGDPVEPPGPSGGRGTPHG